jgi:RNA polymerase subunit RPABC4/transcription elongation factor Spt4
VPRYRIRFLLQELELAGTEIVLGRSPDCQVTIEDPLVSRRHATISLEGAHPTISDLGSRNGVRLNGELISGRAVLRNNDRVRLGTQDLVFLVVDPDKSSRQTRATGMIRQCQSCNRPFPEAASCPHCGSPVIAATQTAEFDTITGLIVEPEAGWAFQLLGEVVERALNADRVAEAERALQRAAKEIDERVRNNRGVDAVSLSKLSLYAFRLAESQGRLEWVRWVLDLYKAHSAMISLDLVESLEGSPEPFRQAIRSEAHLFLEWWSAQRASRAGEGELARAGRLAAALDV